MSYKFYSIMIKEYGLDGFTEEEKQKIREFAKEEEEEEEKNEQKHEV